MKDKKCLKCKKKLNKTYIECYSRIFCNLKCMRKWENEKRKWGRRLNKRTIDWIDLDVRANKEWTERLRFTEQKKIQWEY